MPRVPPVTNATRPFSLSPTRMVTLSSWVTSRTLMSPPCARGAAENADSKDAIIPAVGSVATEGQGARASLEPEPGGFRARGGEGRYPSRGCCVVAQRRRPRQTHHHATGGVHERQSCRRRRSRSAGPARHPVSYTH